MENCVNEGRVSVVIPVLYETDRLPHLLTVLASVLDLRKIR
jgi:hypothetical protein